MYVAGSTYWNIAYGRLPGEAMKDEEGVANMKNLGQNIAWLLSFCRSLRNRRIYITGRYALWKWLNLQDESRSRLPMAYLQQFIPDL